MDSDSPNTAVRGRLWTHGRPEHRTRFLILLTLALGCSAQPAPLASAANPRQKQRAAASLSTRLEAILRSSAASRGFWGIEVVELPGGTVLFNRDAQHLFHPASNMKLFTTAAALEKLGPDFVFHTTVESESGPDAQGRVQNLYLVGKGDPSLCDDTSQSSGTAGEALVRPCSDLYTLAQQIKARGVFEVSGSLIADDTYFPSEPYVHGWAAEDLLWGYGATVSALAFNSNALRLRVKPALKLGDLAQVWLGPLPHYYQLNSGLVTTAAGSENRWFVDRGLDSMRLDVWGQIPLDAGETGERVAIAHPAELVAELFRQALADAGIAVKGEIHVQHLTRSEAAAAAQTTPQSSPRLVLAEHDSQPLREIVRLTNKESRNFYAEMLLRTLGREVKHRGGLEDSLEVLNEFAQQTGTEPTETVFADGSGLSRDDLVTPQALAKLLSHMASGPSFDVFIDSLPLAGEDGTLAGRFQATRLKGRIHAKTGTLEGVNALAGYMNLPSGRQLAFSILGNNHPLPATQAEATLDQMASAVYDWFARRIR